MAADIQSCCTIHVLGTEARRAPPSPRSGGEGASAANAYAIARLATPSPRRGEGGVRGLGRTRKTPASEPPHPRFARPLPSGERLNECVLATRARPSYVNAIRKIVPRSRIASRLTRRWDRPSARSCPTNKREAERRPAHNSILRALRARLALSGARSPVGVPPRHLLQRTNAAAQLQNALPGTRQKTGVTRPPPIPVQRLSRRPVIMPAGRFPGAARERR